jgi:hypothetical protein
MNSSADASGTGLISRTENERITPAAPTYLRLQRASEEIPDPGPVHGPRTLYDSETPFRCSVDVCL